MKIIVTVDLPNPRVDKLWTQKKSQEIKRMIDFYLRESITAAGAAEGLKITSEVEQ